MVSQVPAKLLEEEQIVAELAILGITYLSRLQSVMVEQPRTNEKLMVDLVHQPSSRVRSALIALLLIHPEFSQFIQTAAVQLHGSHRLLLKLFYTAAVLLQRKHANSLQILQPATFCWLPDYFSSELGLVTTGDEDDQICSLGIRHQILTGKIANWSRTYNNTANVVIRRKIMEQTWSQ